MLIASSLKLTYAYEKVPDGSLETSKFFQTAAAKSVGFLAGLPQASPQTQRSPAAQYIASELKIKKKNREEIANQILPVSSLKFEFGGGVGANGDLSVVMLTVDTVSHLYSSLKTSVEIEL